MSIDSYKVPRENFDVEALAQEPQYEMITEDTEFLSYDPNRHGGVRPHHYADQVVPPGGDPEEYLRPANAAITELTPPKSFKDRVLRLHISFPALQVFDQFKFGYALLDHHDLMRQIMKRKTAILNDWRQHEFLCLFPDRVKSNDQVISTSSNHRRLLTPRPSATSEVVSPKVSADEIAEFLNSPRKLLGKQFQHSPPPDEYQHYKGKVMADGEVGHEYQILLDALDGAPLPMGPEEIRFLLMYSTLVVWIAFVVGYQSNSISCGPVTQSQ
ncbi:hypothetical protein C8Q74DRAFT_1315946 [Fomes fomentarius]|nr:hypothetical protein C8Q74DRAFT_1315946 [Fomes fomentarius]